MEQTVFGGEKEESKRPARPVWPAIWNGMRAKCPRCGEGKLFSGFVKTVHACDHCGEEIHHHRADDMPAYIVVLILGHIIVGAVMGHMQMTDMNSWQILAIWVPITIALAVWMLRPVKGAIIGLQWALYMHGFGGETDQIETHPEA